MIVSVRERVDEPDGIGVAKSIDCRRKSTTANVDLGENNNPRSNNRDDNDDSSYNLPKSLFKEQTALSSVPMSEGKHPLRRSFGEELVDHSNNPMSTLDTSLLSMESKDTTVSSITADDMTMTVDSNSDCGTEVSSVAMLRGWLDDFGKQNKNHFEKQQTKSGVGGPPSEAVLERPSRRKVHRPKSTTVQPTPLPPNAANALSKRIGGSAAPDARRSCGKDSFSQRRAVATYTTPIRIKPKVNNEEVQATNDGYASVAKLSAWLADDPTSKKKVKSIRRGANVIAKSRKFDKGLANVIVEQNHIRRGDVSDKKHQIEVSLSGSTEDDGFELRNDTHSFDGVAAKPARSRTTAGSVVSVSDKKQWLSNAFKRTDAPVAVGGSTRKAKSDFISSQDHRDDVTARAKQLWRQRSPTRSAKSVTFKGTPTAMDRKSTAEKQKTRQATPYKALWDEVTPTSSDEDGVPAPPAFAKDAEAKASSRHVKFADDVKAPAAEPAPSEKTPEQSEAIEKQRADVFRPKVAQPNKQIEDKAKASNNDGDVGFHAARALLVKRSKENGSNVEILTKVSRRRAMFEKLEKDNRRKSLPTGMLKPTWQEDSTAGGSGGSKYTKAYVEDIAPKRSFEELP